jgi:hypothetical protein
MLERAGQAGAMLQITDASIVGPARNKSSSQKERFKKRQSAANRRIFNVFFSQSEPERFREPVTECQVP